MYLVRNINLLNLLNKGSLFLLGCRQTGKSSLIKLQLNTYPLIDLHNPEVFLPLHQNPGRLSEYFYIACGVGR